MKLGVVMACYISNMRLLELTLDAGASIQSNLADVTIYLVINKLSLPVSIESIETKITEARGYPVKIILGNSWCVSRSWNAGISAAMRDGSDYILVAGNDTVCRDSTIDELIKFGEETSDFVALWSAKDQRNIRSDETGEVSYDCADYAMYMLRPETIIRYGFFDENFRPAYCEDNDYQYRIMLGGGSTAVVHDAVFFHHGSMTINTDPQLHAASGQNSTRVGFYFTNKWGCKLYHSREDISTYCPKKLWNNESYSLNWWPE